MDVNFNQSFFYLLSFIFLMASLDYVKRASAFVFFLLRKIKPISWRKYWDDHFSVVVPIYGKIDYLKNTEYLKAYGKKVILCTTDQESPIFYQALKEIAKRHGFKIVQVKLPEPERKNINTWLLLKKFFKGHSAILEENCLVLDADTYPKRSLHRLFGYFNQTKARVASLEVLVHRPKTMIQKLQAVEYKSSMSAKTLSPHVTSGAAAIAKRGVMKRIMMTHSGYPNGGDIERGMLAKALGYKVIFIPFSFYTFVPGTFKAWFNQRKFWFSAGFRRNIVNMHFFHWRSPFKFFYSAVLVYLIAPLRWATKIEFLKLMPLIVAVYWIYNFIFNFKNWRPYFLFYPFYCIFQVSIFPIVGLFTYVSRALRIKNAGIIWIRESRASTASVVATSVKMTAFVGSIILLYVYFVLRLI